MSGAATIPALRPVRSAKPAPLSANPMARQRGQGRLAKRSVYEGACPAPGLPGGPRLRVRRQFAVGRRPGKPRPARPYPCAVPRRAVACFAVPSALAAGQTVRLALLPAGMPFRQEQEAELTCRLAAIRRAGVSPPARRDRPGLALAGWRWVPGLVPAATRNRAPQALPQPERRPEQAERQRGWKCESSGPAVQSWGAAE